jgi:cold shock CspA family protein
MATLSVESLHIEVHRRTRMMAEARQRGFVDWYNSERGYGVIWGDDDEEYFVHRSNLTPGLHLAARLDVTFCVRERANQRGLEAYDVMADEESAVPQIPNHRLTGKIAWFKCRDAADGDTGAARRGYGIINAEDDEEYFVHGSNIAESVPLSGNPEVTFLLRLRQRGMSSLEAYDVVLSVRELAERELIERERKAEQRRREEEQRRGQLEREAEQRQRKERERTRVSQPQVKHEAGPVPAASEPPARAASEPSPAAAPFWSPDSLRWREIIAIETGGIDQLAEWEPVLPRTPLPSHSTGRPREDQLPQPATPTSTTDSPAGTGFWYQQFKATGRTVADGADAESKEIETRVVGVMYENRQSVIWKLSEGEQVRLCREPDNPRDKNAIRVERLAGEQIGYISREEAAIFAPAFDKQGRPVTAVVTAVLRGYSSNSTLGVCIRFSVPDSSANSRLSIPDFRDSWEDQP